MALVISLTNMSLLPLELLAAGVIPVMNAGQNNSMVSSNPYIRYATASPHSLASALKEEAERQNLADHSEKAASSVKDLSWQSSCDKFEQIIEKQLNG